jgi:hypothetical protein
MISRVFRPTLRIAAYALVPALSVATLAGCNAGANFTQGVESDTAVATLGGVVHGGPNPVTHATVTLYATSTVASPSSSNAYGYGQAGTVLGTATTNSMGAFTFTSPGTCPAGQQAYIVSAGGYTGSFSASNSAALLMAAIGPCSSLSSSTFIIINEPSTIAAAYAVGQFMSVSGTTVKISAPANNNAATPGCTLTSGQTTSCKAAGLAHAFLNAANLVNAVGATTATPTGAAYAVLPTNSSAVVPQSLINTLANSVEACVNSSGSSSTPCAGLMTDTTPPAALAGGTPPAPTNTLQALIDLAQYPGGGAVAPPATSANTTALYGIGSSIGYYSPSLSVAPTDFTIYINYTAYNGSTAFTAPWNVTTDINDNIYVMDAVGGTTGVRVESFTSNGSPNWVFASNDSVSAGCGSGSERCGMATDTLGHLYVAAGPEIYQILTASGTSTSVTAATPGGLDASTVAVDTNNNAFVTIEGGTLGTNSTIQELKSGGSSFGNLLVGGAADATLYQYITIDNYGNLWLGYQNCCGADYIPNNSLTGTVAPIYTSAPTPITGVNSGDTHMSTLLIDSVGNTWVPDQDYLYEVTLNGFPAATAITGVDWFGGVERQAAMDGDNKIAVAAANGGGGYIGLFYPTGVGAGTPPGGSAFAVFGPCNVTTGTTCGTGVALDDAGRGVAVDDTGSIWFTFTSGSPTTVLQVIGPGAPTWGQASLGAVGNGTTERPY